MISEQTKKLLILKKLKNVGPKILETVVNNDGFESKEVEEIVESEPKLRKVISENNSLIVAEEKVHIDINESKKNGSKIVSVLDDEYPTILRDTSDRPFFLYIKGQLTKRPCVALIGTRKPTIHGEEITRRISTNNT